MQKIRSIRLRKLHGQLTELVYEMTKIQFRHSSSLKTWSPAINCYRCKECIVICADLAGVDKEEIDLQIEPRRVLIRGSREAPEPDPSCYETMQVHALEIDFGAFEREIVLPQEVEPDRLTAEQQNGLLWIYLPIRAHA
jgi:HSP20 family protein